MISLASILEGIPLLAKRILEVLFHRLIQKISIRSSCDHVYFRAKVQDIVPKAGKLLVRYQKKEDGSKECT